MRERKPSLLGRGDRVAVCEVFTSSVICSFLANATFPKGEGLAGERSSPLRGGMGGLWEMEVEEMTDLDKLRDFLLSYPQWEKGRLLYIDRCDEGKDGLFPQGVQELSRKTDVLGNQEVRYRVPFVLYRSGVEEEGDAAWLLDFQKWLAHMSIMGKAPVFGDVPRAETLRAEKGHFDKVRSSSGLYAVTVTAEFTKIYKEDTYGEN